MMLRGDRGGGRGAGWGDAANRLVQCCRTTGLPKGYFIRVEFCRFFEIRMLDGFSGYDLAS